MSRELNSSVSDELQKSVIRPVLLIRLDILSDPLTVWSGPGIFAPVSSGDTALDGQIFMNAAPVADMSNITEDKGIGGPLTLTVSGHDLDEDLLRQVIRDKRQWRGRQAWLWLGLLAADQKTVIGHPFRLKTGYIISINTIRDSETSSVDVIIDRDLGNAGSAAFRYIDHIRYWPDDLFSTFLVKLANKSTGLIAPSGSGEAGYAPPSGNYSGSAPYPDPQQRPEYEHESNQG